MLQNSFSFKCPSKTGSGFRALDQLPGDLTAINAHNPLIITNRYNSEKHLKTIVNAFKCSDLSIGVYDGIKSDSNIETISELSKIYNDNGFDSIIALGHGNIADIAKVLNIAVSGKPSDIKDFTGVDKITNPLKPFAYIPVLRCDGSETSSEAILGDLIYRSDHLMPNIVCIDSRIMIEESPNYVIDSAFKALTIASEAYTENDNPLAGSYAHIAIEFVMTNLKRVVIQSYEEKKRFSKFKLDDTDSMERASLVSASVMGGYIHSNKEEGISEKLGNAVSKRCGIPSGIAMGIILPYSLEYKVYRKGFELENYMLPVAGLDIYCNTPPGQRFDSAIGKVRYLTNELYSITSTEVPRTLEDAGLSESDLSEIAKEVSCDEYHEATCFFILEHAFEGKPVTP